MSAFIAVRALRTAINNGSVSWSRSYAGSSKVTTATGSGNIEAKVSEPPNNVFKKVNTKELGPGGSASKQGAYKNPEYFQYHNMSFAEMDLVMAKMRVAQPSAKGK